MVSKPYRSGSPSCLAAAARRQCELGLFQRLELERNRRQLGVTGELVLDRTRVLDHAACRRSHAEADHPADEWAVGVDAAAAGVVEQRAGLVGERFGEPVEAVLTELSDRVRWHPRGLELPHPSQQSLRAPDCLDPLGLGQTIHRLPDQLRVGHRDVERAVAAGAAAAAAGDAPAGGPPALGEPAVEPLEQATVVEDIAVWR